MKRSTFDIKKIPGFKAAAILCYLMLYLPICILVIYAFNAGPSLSSWDGLSLRWFVAASNNSAVQDAAARSVIVAIAAAGIATAAATMAALATTKTDNYFGLRFKYALINQPLMIPEIVTAVALLIVFSQIKIMTGYTGISYLIAAHTAFCIPFAYLPIRARLENMDSLFAAAAADLYASPWLIFRRVTLPLLRPGIFAGFMLAFVISLDDVVITEFVKSAGMETLPTYMLGQLRRIVTPEINAVATAFLCFSVVLVIIYHLLNRKG